MSTASRAYLRADAAPQLQEAPAGAWDMVIRAGLLCWLLQVLLAAARGLVSGGRLACCLLRQPAAQQRVSSSGTT